MANHVEADAATLQIFAGVASIDLIVWSGLRRRFGRAKKLEHVQAAFAQFEACNQTTFTPEFGRPSIQPEIRN